MFVSGNYQKKRMKKSPANPGDTDCVLAAFPRLEVKKEGIKKQKSCASEAVLDDLRLVHDQ